jgi:hypothetical protein
MRPVRRLMSKLQALPDHPLPMPTPPVGVAPTNANNSNGAVKGVKLLKQAADDVESLLKSDPVTIEDIIAAVAITKPSSDGKLLKYGIFITMW